jgi:hypothetical protein
VATWVGDGAWVAGLLGVGDAAEVELGAVDGAEVGVVPAVGDDALLHPPTKIATPAAAAAIATALRIPRAYEPPPGCRPTS